MSKKIKKKKQELKGFIQSGVIFIGDARYMSGNAQDYEGGIIPKDPTNPFKDFESFLEEHPEDKNLELPGSFNGDLPGRGVVVHTNMLSGSYIIKKKVDKATGKLLEVKIIFKD